MKVIVAGSRGITDIKFLFKAIEKSGFKITEVVSGYADRSPDMLGVTWAKINKIPIKPFPAEWDNLEQLGAILKLNKWGQWYNANAGFYRNQKMADYADALIAIWDSKSKGTSDMITRAIQKGLQVYVYLV